jgi:hypothetical protein
VDARRRVRRSAYAAAALWLIDLENELTFSGDAGNVDADVNPNPFNIRGGLQIFF